MEKVVGNVRTPAFVRIYERLLQQQMNVYTYLLNRL